MSSAAQPTQSPSQSETYVSQGFEWSILLPYVVAILSQVPMLYLYYMRLAGEPHYGSVGFAILATVVFAAIAWPRNQALQFHQSQTSNLLLWLGVIAAGFSVLFVEPWMSALAVMLIVTSLLARTYDKETGGSLWFAALPLYVFLALPFGLDRTLITTLQYYSATYTSRLLDLAGIGHHMDGTKVNVPNMAEYGIEEACSGVQSFFTLVLVAVVFSVFTRRVKAPAFGIGALALMAGVGCFMFRWLPGAISADYALSVFWSNVFLVMAAGFVLFSIVGFRTALLVLSAVFWAMFMNTIRILAIPVAQYFLELDLASGLNHTLLGYTTLIFGIVLVISTDQFVLFLFGPVENASDAGQYGRVIGKFWNGLSGKTAADTGRTRRRTRSRQPVSPFNQKMLWAFSGLMVVAGLWQIYDVRATMNSTKDLEIQVFQSDVTVEFEEGDLPKEIDGWTQVRFDTNSRNIGSDFGERSDVWQYRSVNCAATASLDQTFPGWHELTTCYRNTGWEITGRKALSPAQALDLEPDQVPDNSWHLIEVTMEKPTGERGYLLFSHFDSFGLGLEVPRKWGTVNGFITRVLNRLSHRIRASLLHGEAYQIQVFLTSYNDFDPAVTLEARDRYLTIREEVRKRFLDKKSAESSEPAEPAA